MATPINELRQDQNDENHDTDLVNGIINELENENQQQMPQQVSQQVPQQVPQQYYQENYDNEEDRVEYYPPDEFTETFFQKVLRLLKPAVVVALIIFLLNNAYAQNLLTKIPYLANSLGHLNIVGKIALALVGALIFLILSMFIN